MSNESPNNDFYWRNKLEGLESNTGKTFNKEAAWDKLHGRLQKKSGNKKLVWRYAAAACLLLALTLAWFWPASKENAMVKNNVEHGPVQKPGGIQAPSNNKDSIAFISIIPDEKKSLIPIESHNKINNPTDHKIFTVENVITKRY